MLLHRLAGRVPEEPSEEFYEEEIRTVVTEGHREGMLEEDAREMIESVIELRDVDVSEIMTPRTDMMSIRVGATLDDAAAFVAAAGHSRIPVFEKTRDDIIGILYVKDLLSEILKQPSQRAENVADLVRPPYFVPETKPINSLLQEFQKNRNHIAIVLDEYGGVSGLVTIEDVLEEIVGEIADEHDDDLVEGIRTIDERSAEALAMVHVDEVNDRLGISLPDEGEFDTIGGLVFSRLGHVPKPGEEVVIDDVRITVVDVTRRRIERVKIEVLDPSRTEPA
jgi:CBS domain containing-hemolysin-like protein